MERVGVRQLRQNASKVVSDVELHGPVIVTVSGRDAVLMAPVRQHRWVPAEEARRLLASLGADTGWAEELERQRDGDHLSDPWGPR